MSLAICALVIAAAIMHAGWNALLRAGSDRLWSITIMSMSIAIACGFLVWLVPMPAASSWGYATASAILHVGYNFCLIRTYRSGDLGQTYPISRGSSPLLVSIGAAAFAGELPDVVSMIGVLLISSGIISLAFQGKRIVGGSLPYALMTGCFIGAYSVVDGIGSRLSGTPVGYVVWMCLIWGLLMPAAYVCIRDWRTLFRGPPETLMAAGGGLVSLLAYGIVIFAMSLGPMGPVSALRETSVVFAALIGWIFLHERLTALRIIACTIIALGAVCIGFGDPHATRLHSKAARVKAGACLPAPFLHCPPLFDIPRRLAPCKIAGHRARAAGISPARLCVLHRRWPWLHRSLQ